MKKITNGRKRRISSVVTQLSVTLVLFMFMFPFLWMVLSALKTRQQAFAYPPVWVFRPTFDNFRAVITQYDLLYYMKNSLIVSLGNTIFSLVFALPASYGLARFRFRHSELIGYIFLILQMVPAMSVVFAYFFLAQKLRLYDTHITLIVVYSLWHIPWAIWMIRGFIEGIPPALEEAAVVDGCSRFGAFMRITLPLAMPGIAAAAVFVFIMCWNEFTVAFFLTGRAARTIPTTASIFVTHLGVLWGPMFATATIATIPVMAFAMVFRKYMVSALTMGAVKE